MGTRLKCIQSKKWPELHFLAAVNPVELTNEGLFFLKVTFTDWWFVRTNVTSACELLSPVYKRSIYNVHEGRTMKGKVQWVGVTDTITFSRPSTQNGEEKKIMLKKILIFIKLYKLFISRSST